MLSTHRLLPTIRSGLHKNYPSFLQAPLCTRPALFTSVLAHRTVFTWTQSLSPVPKNPLGEGKYIQTAACLIIGDEILNGKTHDMNSNYFAKYCFQHGIDLKRIEVIADDEDQIIEASRRMVKTYVAMLSVLIQYQELNCPRILLLQAAELALRMVNFPALLGLAFTKLLHRRYYITYASLARAFSQSLSHNAETLTRMNRMIKHMATQTPQQRAATERMALFPDRAEVLVVAEDIWVPVVRLEGKLCIFPGIPSLFQRMLAALTPLLPLPPRTERPSRIQVFTERPESMIAPYLTKLQSRLRPHGIQVGSYPVLGQGVFVSLIGRDRLLTTSSATPVAQTSADVVGEDGSKKGSPRILLAEVAREVEQAIDGQVVSEEEVAKRKAQCKQLASPVTVAANIGVPPETALVLKAKC
ncbi:MoCF-biosynth domain-containing protein [Mycena sanguinolenta]|uniref:MoCF-biosynth domain-containing protein n=1 Tax=Mycena sanguinolenta TaxID=230812 RepID=A0A8H7DIZ1_9AGAR|nr:MoCF-biosynth domain-containing protein [Mycena sanguinolenta]